MQEYAHLFWDELLLLVDRRYKSKHPPPHRLSCLALASPSDCEPVAPPPAFSRTFFDVSSGIDASSDDDASGSPEKKRLRCGTRLSPHELQHLRVHMFLSMQLLTHALP